MAPILWFISSLRMGLSGDSWFSRRSPKATRHGHGDPAGLPAAVECKAESPH